MDFCEMLVSDLDIKVHRFISAPIDANMYVLIFGDEALVIDPNENDDAYELLPMLHSTCTHFLFDARAF